MANVQLHQETFQVEKEFPLYFVGTVEATVNGVRKRLKGTHANIGRANELYEVHPEGTITAKSSPTARIEWAVGTIVFEVDGHVRHILANFAKDQKRESADAVLTGFAK
jgi:hypothetical protein